MNTPEYTTISMSRPIKFRAWDKYRQEFVNPAAYVSLFNYNGDKNIAVATPDGINITLQQYTGLKDKNGVEIYEGDFLEDYLYVEWCEKQAGFQCWLPDDYCLACNGDMHWHEVVADMTYEVIGNIYENPELIS